MSQRLYPNGPALDPAHAAAKQWLGRASCYPHLLPHEEEDFVRKRHSGWSLSTPFLLPHTPALSLPILEEKFGFRVRHAPARLNTQNAHIALPQRWGREGGWARVQVTAWRASPPTPSQDP